MARFKYIDTQPKLIPVDLAQQLLPGTFEHALHHLLDRAIDLSHFDARYRNDETGTPRLSAGHAPPGGAVRVRAGHREQSGD